jgi:hypothetical protein
MQQTGLHSSGFIQHVRRKPMGGKSPAPWNKGTWPGQSNYIFSKDDRAVVQAVNPEDIDVITAAPELLDALIGTMRTMVLHHGADCNCKECSAARHAIKKAKGECP